MNPNKSTKDEKYISITEMAKLRELTTETLRYYDRIGLFKPDIVDTSTKYRYYSILKYDILGTIKQLRQLEMSVNDISEYFIDKNLSKSFIMLNDLYLRLDKKTKELNKLKHILKSKIAFMEEYVNTNSAPFSAKIKVFQDRKVIESGVLVDGLVEYAEGIIDLENTLNEIAPVLGINREGGFIPINQDSITKKWGPWIPFIFVKSFRNIPKRYQRIIPGGEFVCASYNDYYLRLEPNAFNSILNFIDENNYEIIGDVIACDMLDVTVTDRLNEMVIELQVPVRKKIK